MLTMSDVRHHDSLCRRMAPEFVSNDDPRTTPGGSQQLAKEPHRGESVPLWLHQDIDHNAVLIHGTPEIKPFAVDGEERDGIRDAICLRSEHGVSLPPPRTGGRTLHTSAGPIRS